MLGYSQQRYQSYYKGVGNILSTIGGTIGSFVAASQQKDYYEGLKAAQAQSAANARALQAAKAESMRVTAELTSEEYLNDARLAYQDAINTANTTKVNLKRDQQEVSRILGSARATQGASGVEVGTGSTLDVVRDLEEQGKKLVTTNYRQSLNNVTALLQEEARLKTAASVVKFNTEEQIRFDKAEVSALA